jgi:hypothetical protein
VFFGFGNDEALGCHDALADESRRAASWNLNAVIEGGSQHNLFAKRIEHHLIWPISQLMEPEMDRTALKSRVKRTLMAFESTVAL